ncbi:MAG: response regulator [Candidatus Omnitrophica bacterium]|nr:response regulator [Candidatus Omnitrophota bacterium]
MKKNRTILVIDDDPSMVKVLEKWLPVAGHKVFVAPDGEKGLEVAVEIQPDMIILDLMLPGIGGVNLTKRLKSMERTEKIPIIFITACMGVEKDEGDEEIIIDRKSYSIFAKPLHNAKLLSEIRKELNRNEHQA